MPSAPSRRLKPLGGLEGQPGEGTTATPHICKKTCTPSSAPGLSNHANTMVRTDNHIPRLRTAQRLL